MGPCVTTRQAPPTGDRDLFPSHGCPPFVLRRDLDDNVMFSGSGENAADAEQLISSRFLLVVFVPCHVEIGRPGR